MAGEPLHLCAAGHQPMLYTGYPCPFCDLRRALTVANKRIDDLEGQVRSLIRTVQQAAVQQVKEPQP
jgi:hypothetical protein